MPNRHKTQEKLFDPTEHEAKVKTWKTIKMKEYLDYRKPYAAFLNIKNGLDNLDDGICTLVDSKHIKGGNCLCGKVPHTNDCLFWPHFTLIVLNPDENRVSIPSLWVEPVTFKSNEAANKTAVEIVLEETTVPQESVFVEEDDTFADKLPPQEAVIEGRVLESVTQKDVEGITETKEAELIIVHLNAKGKLLIYPLENFIKEEEFCFVDEKKDVWLFGDIAGNLNKVSILGDDQKDGFLIVMEFKIQPLHDLLLAFDAARRAMSREDFSKDSQDVEKLISTFFSSMIARI